MTKDTISSFEFFEMFPDEKSARIYFEDIIWDGKPICPYCKYENVTNLQKEGIYRCRLCRLDFTVRVGTVMYRSKISLRKWVYAMYLVFTSRKGISSIQLSKELGITQKSAWFLLHRIREACTDNDDKLSGIVEIDETYIGGKKKNKHNSKKSKWGRGLVGKIAVFGMRERESGRVRAFPIKDTLRNTLQSNIHKNIEKGSTIYTDDHRGYIKLRGYNHSVINHSAKIYVDGMISTNGIESIWAVLKRGYIGVYHWMSPKHLAKYINEFTFRLNKGNDKIPTLERINSLIIGMVGKRLSYKTLIK